MPKRGHVMLQELVEALNPAQNTNGYTFRGLEHLLENSLVKAVPRAIPVYIFVDGGVSTHSERTGTDVWQFLTAVHAVQTRHPNVTVVLMQRSDTLMNGCGISFSHSRCGSAVFVCRSECPGRSSLCRHSSGRAWQGPIPLPIIRPRFSGPVPS